MGLVGRAGSRSNPPIMGKNGGLPCATLHRLNIAYEELF